MIGSSTPYKELPEKWTIAREEWNGVPKWYGLHGPSGKETVRFKSYGGALKAVQDIEWLKQPWSIPE